MEQKSVAEMATEIKTAFETKLDGVKEQAEKALADAAAGKELNAATKESLDVALTEMNGLKAQITALEQKAARGGGDDVDTRTLGQKFAEQDEFKSMSNMPRNGQAVSMEVKADITTARNDAAGSVGAAILPNRLPGILALPQQRLTIRQLLMPGRTDGPLIQYLQETGFTNNAAPVAEGALKPQSDIKLGDKSITTKVLAHWFRVSKQTLSDVAQIESLIDTRLLFGLQLVEERQMLYGDGTGENLLGIVPQATPYAVPTGARPASQTLDVLRLAMLQAALAEFPATGHVLNPIDWDNIIGLKDTDGRYIIGNPQGTATPTLWGIPVVATPAMTVGKFLTGAFQLGAQIFDQWTSRIEVGFQNDDFVRNKVTILAEERLALAVYRPEAFIYGDTAVAPAGG
ncbi:phage major capsid protein [Falsirhodobacter halotolerans]|uniref:phage major capsid protein n=1 Tax=Falsirhodobacter halotolerans TaxID=1146892 RepID=UPI001FD504D4|nr:phage major capsid protein [Falsirhodobacter halotolerans]MCJ8139508.1 phage major capsid protein [Falsirhodobacter halotolerans]